MWISSLQTNPDCEFVAIVLSSLHKRISIDHDDDVILCERDLDESRSNGEKRASATNFHSSKNNNATKKRRKRQKVVASSEGTEADCVATTSEETAATPARRMSPRKNKGQTAQV